MVERAKTFVEAMDREQMFVQIAQEADKDSGGETAGLLDFLEKQFCCAAGLRMKVSLGTLLDDAACDVARSRRQVFFVARLAPVAARPAHDGKRHGCSRAPVSTKTP